MFLEMSLVNCQINHRGVSSGRRQLNALKISQYGNKANEEYDYMVSPECKKPCNLKPMSAVGPQPTAAGKVSPDQWLFTFFSLSASQTFVC